MKLKDITKEQCIIIANYLYDPSLVTSQDFTFHYQPYDPTWYEDAREYVTLSWTGIAMGTTTYNFKMEITNNFDVYFFYTDQKGSHNLGTRNQQLIHRQLINWNCEPDDVPKEQLRNDKLNRLLNGNGI